VLQICWAISNASPPRIEPLAIPYSTFSTSAMKAAVACSWTCADSVSIGRAASNITA